MQKVAMTLLGLGAPPSNRRKGALIVPSAAPGSIGDDAMITSLVTELHEAGEGPVRVLALGEIGDWSDVSPATLLRMPLGKARIPVLARAMRQMQRVYVIGADCLDGHYSPRLSLSLIGSADLAAHVGALSTIIGSSFKDNPVQATVDAIRKLHPKVRICGRDPRTVERLRSIAGRDSELVADVAFMLRATRPKCAEADRVQAWIGARRAGGRRLVGVNFNRQVLGAEPDPAITRALFQSHVGAVQALLATREQVDVLFMPHDYRGSESDHDHARQLAQHIGLPDRATALDGVFRASEIKHFASQMDLVLTGRMHLAIEAMGAGVPVVCVTYQDKFEGLFDHFRMPPLVLSPEQVNEQSLAALLADGVGRVEELRAMVQGRLGEVRRMSRLNLGF